MKLNIIARSILSIIFAGMLAASCSDIANLEKEISSLENRVQALEGQINTLNKNIEAIQALANGGCISNLKEENGTYTITLADGRVITLKQGSIGVANAPVVGIDKDGYWTVDYGQGPEHILVNGQKVKAAGSDGFSPLFGVDVNNNWTVSYDGGKSWQTIKGADGQPVSALPKEGIQDKWFNDVTVKDGKLVVVLKNGETYSLPIVKDFICAIQNSASPVIFNAGETKTFPVEMKGVASTLVTAPQGWSASLSQSALAITAPAMTKAVSADSKTEVCILATSAEGFASIAKVKVQLSDKPIVVNPTATVTFESAEVTTITFKVSTIDVTSWKYIILPATEPAPTEAEFETKGIEGKELVVKTGNLTADTEYAFYVLPMNNTKKGAVASAKGKTLPEPVVELPGLYNNYEKGLDVEIGGVIVNKKTHGPANYISATSQDKTIKTGVNFVEADAQAVFASGATTLPVFVAGNITQTRSPLSTNGQVKFKSGADVAQNVFAIENIDLKLVGIDAATTKYVFANNADNAIEKVSFKNCKIEMMDHVSLMSVGTVARKVNSFFMTDSDVKLAQHFGTNTINILQTKGVYTMSEVNFTNNVFWSPVDAASVSLLHNRDVTVSKLTIVHNTMVKVYPQATYAYCQIKDLTDGMISNNLMYLDNYPTAVGAKYCGIVREIDGVCSQPLYEKFLQNYAIYNTTIPTQKMKVGQNCKFGQIFSKNLKDSEELFDYTTGSANFDLEKGVFKPKKPTYGAKR